MPEFAKAYEFVVIESRPLWNFRFCEGCGRRPPWATRHRHGAGIRKPSQYRKWDWIKID